MALESADWNDVLAILISVLAGVVLFIAIKAYRRTPTTRVLLFASAFGAYFLRGVFIALEVFFFTDDPVVDGLVVVADAATLVLFVLAMLKG